MTDRKKGSVASPLSSGLSERIDRDKKSFRQSLLKWWSTNKRYYPWRHEDLSPYEVLIAEVLLRRTTATAAETSYRQILAKYPDIQSIADARASALEKALSRLGLQKQRALGLKQMASHLCEKENCSIPEDLDGLIAIPHIGPYAARAVLSFAYKKPSAVVDGNVIRVYNRFFSGLLPHEANLNIFQAVADIMLHRKRHRDFNFALLDLGALICRPSHPMHKVCPVQGLCNFPKGLLR